MSTMVTAYLRRAILENRLPPGARLLQSEVAAELGVSRQPVREAFRTLETERIVARATGGGVRVRVISREEVAENYLLRRLLESEAAFVAASVISDEDLRRIEELHEALIRATETDDEEGVLRGNAAFHLAICESSRMPQLVRCVNILRIGVTWPGGLNAVERAKFSVPQHQAIINALRDGSPEMAKSAMAMHISAAERDHARSQRPDLPRQK